MMHKRKIFQNNSFFIIGAPKSGTTSLAAWLRDTPGVDFSKVKEPHFFSLDIHDPWRQTETNYLKNFKFDNDNSLFGEASVWYLLSNSAIPSIETYCSNPKYIVCLRNPVEMVLSLYHQLSYAGFEHYTTLEKAWHVCNSSQPRGRESYGGLDPLLLNYKVTCTIGAQVSSLLRRVERNRIKFILFDDLKSDSTKVYKDVAEFLNVRSDKISKLPVINKATQRKSKFLRSLTLNAGHVKRLAGIDRSFGLLGSIDRWNTKPLSYSKLSSDFNLELSGYFKNDIELLESEIGLSLSHWK